MCKKAIAVITMLGGNREAAIFYGVTDGAISQWKASGLPPARELELLRRRPEIFAAAQEAAKVWAGRTAKAMKEAA